MELRGSQVDDIPLVPSGVDNGNLRKNIDQLFEPRKKIPKMFLRKIFLEFFIFPCPPPFFSTRYIIKCYIIPHFGRRSTSESVAGGEGD